MKINFKELAKRDEPLQLVGDIKMDGIVASRRDILQHSPIHVELEVSQLAGIVQVDGQLNGELVISCSRCLEEVKKHIQVPFLETFSQDEQYADEDDDESNVIYIPQDEFSLVPYLEAAFLLNIPFVVLCKEDCRGLCPVCGTNRNEADCACENERIDPRLADLQKFFEK